MVMGDPPPQDLVAVPVTVKGRTIACLLGDLPGESVLAAPVHEIVSAAKRAGVAFEMLIMRNKIAS